MRPQLVKDRHLLLQLVLVVLGAGTVVFGVITLVAPYYALTQLGLSDLSDSGLFAGSLLGAFMVPWGASLVVAGRNRNSGRMWVALTLANSTAVMVVLVFFLGKGTISLGGVWPLMVIYGIGLAGTAGLGHRQLRGQEDVQIVQPDRSSPTAQDSYRINLESESDREDILY